MEGMVIVFFIILFHHLPSLGELTKWHLAGSILQALLSYYSVSPVAQPRSQTLALNYTHGPQPELFKTPICATADYVHNVPH